MLINLLAAFNAKYAEQYKIQDIQTSFNFEKSPAVVFVRELDNLTPVDYYDELDTYPLSAKDKEKVTNTQAEIKSNGGYDGNQLLIVKLAYDPDANTLYLVALRVKYSFIRTLQKSIEAGGFDADSIYHNQTFCTAGVRAPFITRDAHTYFMMRTRAPKAYSVAAGFLEPPKGQLHPAEACNNLVTYVAHNEVLEEFIGHSKYSAQSLQDQLAHARVKIEHSGLAAIAIRRAKGASCIEIEFINPMKINCTQSRMSYIIAHNTARDAYEHVTNKVICIPLDSSRRLHAEAILAENEGLAGKYLRDPIIGVTSILANPNCRFFPTVLPGEATTEFVAVSALKSKIYAPLSIEAADTQMKCQQTLIQTISYV
jgi:hypothetical protein